MLQWGSSHHGQRCHFPDIGAAAEVRREKRNLERNLENKLQYFNLKCDILNCVFPYIFVYVTYTYLLHVHVVCLPYHCYTLPYMWVEKRSMDAKHTYTPSKAKVYYSLIHGVAKKAGIMHTHTCIHTHT